MALTGVEADAPNVEHILKQMSLDEKIQMLAAKNVWETPEIKRVSIPSLKVRIQPRNMRAYEADPRLGDRRPKWCTWRIFL